MKLLSWNILAIQFNKEKFNPKKAFLYKSSPGGQMHVHKGIPGHNLSPERCLGRCLCISGPCTDGGRRHKYVPKQFGRKRCKHKTGHAT